MKEFKLTNRQIQAITHFLTSSSIEETCRKANISKTTFYKWLKDETFKDFLEEKRKEMVKEALQRLQVSINKAVAVLIDLMSTGNESIRRLASRDIIGYALKSIEIQEIEERLEKVERLVLERRSYR